MMEEWKDIPGLDGKYQVSNLGQVRSQKKLKDGTMLHHCMKIFKGGQYDESTARVELTPYGSKQYKSYYIPNLVAWVFLDIPYGSCMVFNIDGDCNNNAVSNLTIDVKITDWYNDKIHLDEEWRDVIGYEGDYQVSNYGRFRTLPRMINHSATGYNFRKGVIHEYRPDGDTHIQVQLWRDGRFKQFELHRLIAEVFIPNPENKPQINHIDGNKRNNVISNLEWCTPQENTLHALRTGLASGDGRPKPVRCITTGVVYSSIAEAARCCNIYRQSINESICRNEPYAGYQFEWYNDEKERKC